VFKNKQSVQVFEGCLSLFLNLEDRSKLEERSKIDGGDLPQDVLRNESGVMIC
jgi:hypothetical protein